MNPYKEDVVNAIRDILVEQDKSLAVAESVTAGHVQAAFSLGFEASKFFQGGITAYNLGQKTRHLNIDPILGDKVNCVAGDVAKNMALEVNKMFTSDYGVGITGYASPMPDSKGALFAYFALAYRQKIVSIKKLSSAVKSPFEVQVYYANEVLKHTLTYLQKNTKKR